MVFVIGQRLIETYSLPKRSNGLIVRPHSLTILTVLHLGCMIGSILEYYLFTIHRGLVPMISVLGFVLYVGGLLVRNWAKYTLRQHWSLQVEILPNHQIIREGPYQYVRHPAYTAIIMEVIGIPMISNAYWTMMFFSLPYICVLMWRVHIEEQALVQAVGEPYIQFQRDAPRFLPYKIKIFNKKRKSRQNL